MKLRKRIERRGMFPHEPVPVGKILVKEFLKPLGLNQTTLALHMRVPRKRINEIIRGKRKVTPDTAYRLAAVFETSAEFWVSLQTRYDMWRCYNERHAQYQKIQPINS